MHIFAFGAIRSALWNSHPNLMVSGTHDNRLLFQVFLEDRNSRRVSQLQNPCRKHWRFLAVGCISVLDRKHGIGPMRDHERESACFPGCSGDGCKDFGTPLVKVVGSFPVSSAWLVWMLEALLQPGFRFFLAFPCKAVMSIPRKSFIGRIALTPSALA